MTLQSHDVILSQHEGSDRPQLTAYCAISYIYKDMVDYELYKYCGMVLNVRVGGSSGAARAYGLLFKRRRAVRESPLNLRPLERR